MVGGTIAKMANTVKHEFLQVYQPLDHPSCVDRAESVVCENLQLLQSDILILGESFEKMLKTVVVDLTQLMLVGTQVLANELQFSQLGQVELMEGLEGVDARQPGQVAAGGESKHLRSVKVKV